MAACQPKQLFVPIEDVELSNDAKIRGISLKVISFFQNISLFASADRNETYVYGQKAYCDRGYTDIACVSFRGGLYNASLSRTKAVAENRTQVDMEDALWVQDAWAITPNVSLSNFTFGNPDQDLNSAFISQAQLGLGQNSSFLRTLKDAGHIGSRAFSIFWGLVGGPQSQQTSGALILGELDQGLVGSSENFTGTLNYRSNCSTGMLVTINDISLNWPNGTDSSIFGGSRSSVIQACIAPSFAGLMTIPFDYWKRFQALAGGRFPGGSERRSKGINFFTMLYEPEDVYYGDLTVTLQNSISIRVPNTELVVPDRIIDKSNGKIYSDDSVRDLVLNSIQAVNVNDLPVIGRLLLTSAYLSVNHDSSSFSLWQADTSAQMGALMALDEENGVTGEFCSNSGNVSVTDIRPTAGPSTTSTTDSGLPSSLVGTSAVHLSRAVIGGIATGSVAIVAALIAFFLVIVRWKGRKAVKMNTDLTPPPRYASKPNLLAMPTEIEAERGIEMSAEKDEKPELGGREKVVIRVELEGCVLEKNVAKIGKECGMNTTKVETAELQGMPF